MSGGFWEDDSDDFRDNPVEFESGPPGQKGQWKAVETAAPAPQQRPATAAARPEPTYEEGDGDDDWSEEDFQVVEAQEDSEDEDYSEVLSDARLRLEQGKLYELIMNHDLFGGLEADPKAVRNVQKEIKRFAKERMEVMLGMRAEGAEVPVQVQSPFNSLEVEILKKLASKATGGATEAPDAEEIAEVIKPKRQALNTISAPAQAPTRRAPPKRLATQPAAPIRRRARPEPQRQEEYEPLDKPVHEMTAEELMEHNKKASARQAGKRARASGALPPATYEQQEFIAHQQAMSAGNSPGVTRLVDTINVLAKAAQTRK